MTREFIFERATKNTYRYQEDLEALDPGVRPMPDDLPVVPVIGTIYIQKHALPTKPQRIRVTVEEVR